MNKLILNTIILIAFSLSSVCHAFEYTMNFSESELQGKIEALMPIEKQRLFFRIIISEPKLDLLDDVNKLSIKSNIKAIGPGGIEGAGFVKIEGSINYIAEEGAFYLRDPKIVKMHVNGIPQKFQEKIAQIAQNSLEKSLVKKPIYRLKEDDMKQQLAKSVLKSVVVKDESLQVTLSAF